MANAVGVLLRRVRAGQHRLVWAQESAQAPDTGSTLTSTSFDHGQPIPIRHADKKIGAGVSPPLDWSGLPEGTVECLLILEDPDAPMRNPFTHALVAGIDPATGSLREGALNSAGGDPDLVNGRLFRGNRGYLGPRPIPSHGRHSYVFQLYALDRPTGLAPGFTRQDAIDAMRGHVVGRARLDGTFETP
jgi:Raf kinase inhibitor-like YbhB/YbcL family protein